MNAKLLPALLVVAIIIFFWIAIESDSGRASRCSVSALPWLACHLTEE